MKKIAIVVQRFGKEITGGSEKYALELAKLYSKKFKVDILTTTAKNHLTWKNEYQKGNETYEKNILIKRFAVDFEKIDRGIEKGDIYSCLFYKIHDGLTDSSFNSFDNEIKYRLIRRFRKFPFGAIDDFIKYQGPYSSELLNYLENYNYEYNHVIFITYLYATTYFGIDRIQDKEKVFIIPTYHDELIAYAPSFYKYAKYKHLFLTNAEKRFAETHIYENKVISEIISFGMEDKYNSVPYRDNNENYILYAGRLEEAKGVQKLFEMFEKYYVKNQDLKLYIIGDGKLKEHKHPGITYKGFVDEKEKLVLMRNAIAFIHPSALESLGIALLEAFMMGTPAIVNAESDVLKDHILESKAGYAYENNYDFFNGIKALNNEDIRNEFSINARNYFIKFFSKDQFIKNLNRII